jgi:hypothetical protein
MVAEVEEVGDDIERVRDTEQPDGEAGEEQGLITDPFRSGSQPFGDHIGYIGQEEVPIEEKEGEPAGIEDPNDHEEAAKEHGED